MISESESVRLVFGLKLKTLRLQKGLSYQQLAESTGLSLSYLHDIETGKKYPKADKILALAKALSVDYDYLVSLRSSKKLQPIIDLISSDFLNAVPWTHFGLSPAAFLELFVNTPDKVTAFISSLLKIYRSYQMSRENFYMAALRSYQDLYDNYFEDLEVAAKECRRQIGVDSHLALSPEILESVLKYQYGITVNRKKLSSMEALQTVRSFYSEKQKVLFINRKLSTAQENFLLARELSFQFLQMKERPYETIMQESASFDILLNNFRASYFAAALFIPEEEIIDELKKLMNMQRWNEAVLQNMFVRFNVTPEMLMQRLMSILPHHFGIESLFFLRVAGRPQEDEYEITKELHLSQVHNPYANEMHEHYCRRWIAVNVIRDAAVLEEKKRLKQPLIKVQISQYWQTHNRYFCISVVKPRAKSTDDFMSVTIGILIDSKILQRFQFLHDPAIQVKTVHTTCERCSIEDCPNRAAEPVFIKQEVKRKDVLEALKALDENR
jgi:transcriptional regulator with XRE-family HTH domain/Zn-dependent peptidase ImmA (M78 family)